MLNNFSKVTQGEEYVEFLARASQAALVVKNPLPVQETVFDLWVRKIPKGSKWQPIPLLLPGESHGQRNLVGYSP